MPLSVVDRLVSGASEDHVFPSAADQNVCDIIAAFDVIVAVSAIDVVLIVAIVAATPLIAGLSYWALNVFINDQKTFGIGIRNIIGVAGASCANVLLTIDRSKRAKARAPSPVLSAHG